MTKKPINIWNNIERCWVHRLDIVYEGTAIVGIHHSDYINIIKDIDKLCKELQRYKSEMEFIYENEPPNKRSSLATYIYLMLDKNTNFYKIGRSINPTHREKTLQSEKPTIIKIFISPLTNPKNEKIFHSKFNNKRIRGEWYNLNSDDIKFIKNYNYGS